MSTTHTPSQPIRVALFSGDDADHYTELDPFPALFGEWGFTTSVVGLSGILALNADDPIVLYLPGGWYKFDNEVAGAIERFVKAGGGCVGSCCGAYNMLAAIPLIQGGVRAVNMRGHAYVCPRKPEHPIVREHIMPAENGNGQAWAPIPMTHKGGAFMCPDDRDTIVASFDPEGEFGAILAADVGNGRAVAIASHPEIPVAPLPGDEPPDNTHLEGHDPSLIVRDAIRWAACTI